jgi:hypothetical protein
MEAYQTLASLTDALFVHSLETGHFGDNNLEQQLVLIFGRILILPKHQLQCISVYAVAYLSGVGTGAEAEALEQG